MRAQQYMYISIAVLLAGGALGAAVFVLPQVRTHQTLISHGPNTPYGIANYTISGYFIPPIPAGTVINLTLTDFKIDSLSISLFPSDSNSLAPIGSPLLFEPGIRTSVYHVIGYSTADQAYAIYITSLNRTGFTLEVQSVWSPFYPLRGYLPVSFFLILLGAVGTASFSQARKREEEYERAVAEVRSRRA